MQSHHSILLSLKVSFNLAYVLIGTTKKFLQQLTTSFGIKIMISLSKLSSDYWSNNINM